MTSIIPRPRCSSETEGVFSADPKKLRVYTEKEFSSLNAILGDALCESESDASVKIIYSAEEKQEGYSLEITEKGVVLEASSSAGAFYGLQSLRQLVLLSDSNGDLVTLKALRISHDSPLYEWRGLHLDESRHFFGKQTVKKLLSFMALYKLNRFHWHLTDDQGWRIEIEKYPLLTEKGSKRTGSQLHHWGSKEFDSKEVSGFYTKEDIREIVAYARERFIEIVPEIDFPAHIDAALACYKELACREIDCNVFVAGKGMKPDADGNKNWNRPICLGKDSSLGFVFDVLDEVSELFPFSCFHVGGDEAPTAEWKKCPHCQKRIKDEGLRNEVELQGWFTNKVNEHLRSRGKTMIGWNEILESDFIDSDIIAQYWTPKEDKNIIRHLESNGKVILSCHKHFYFDMNYSYCTVKNTYSFTPEAAEINGNLKSGVLGCEAELWTEFIESEKELFFKLWHRGLALSEACWSAPGEKDYALFTESLQRHKKLADLSGWYYGKDRYTLDSHSFRNRFESIFKGYKVKFLDTEYRLDTGEK